MWVDISMAVWQFSQSHLLHHYHHVSCSRASQNYFFASNGCDLTVPIIRSLVPLALSALTLLMNFCAKVTLLGGKHIYVLFTCTRTFLLITVVVSAVRSHNVARINKSYESYGDRFTTTVIEDLATSDLSQAVKGLCELPFLYSEAECVPGVDAIIHVASPLANAASPQVILDVRRLRALNQPFPSNFLQ